MKIKERVVNMLRSFLNIQDPSPTTYVVQKTMDEQATTFKNIIWYGGQTNELAQFYSQMPNKLDTFWGAIQTAGLEIRRIHTGLPATIVDALTDIIITDYNGINFNGNKAIEKLWEEIAEENNFREDVLEKAIRQGLYKGKGAFKLSLDPELSKYPIIEYFGKDRVEYIKKRGRLVEIVFTTYFKQRAATYMLKEHYGFGYITYNLYSYDGKQEYELSTCEYTKDLVDLEFDKSFMMAVPFKIKENAIYDKKTDLFDSYDEAYSQWMNAIRDGRTRTYIPENLIPRDKNGGYLLKPNPFDNKFIRTESDISETGKNEIKTEQPNIQVDSYMSTYITALDGCLQGIISPATLGIDSKKITDPNATAQREKEKTTLWTRGKIVDSLDTTLPKLIKTVFYANQTLNKDPLKEVEADVDFGEYANPSFEAQVETVAKAKQGQIMSIEASVEELYGDTKDDIWKKEEVSRLKNEQGIVEVGEIPAVNNVVTENTPYLSQNKPTQEDKATTNINTSKTKKGGVNNEN